MMNENVGEIFWNDEIAAWTMDAPRGNVVIRLEKAIGYDGLYVECSCGHSMGPLSQEMAHHYAKAHREVHSSEVFREMKDDLLLRAVAAATQKIDTKLIYGSSTTSNTNGFKLYNNPA